MSKRRNISLDQLPLGARGLVDKLEGGRDYASRLAGMGISVGCQIEVLQNPAHGPLLVLVRDTRIALGRREASKILVRESEREQPDAAE